MKRGESVLDRLPRSLWVWAGLAIIFVGFTLFWVPQLVLFQALGLDPGRKRSARFAASGLRAFLAWNAGVLGRARVRGLEEIRGSGPYVVVANHESYLDTALIMASLPLPLRLIARAEIRAIPFLGAAAQVIGVLFAPKGETEEPEPGAILASAVTAVRGGASVVFFPEGTRSRGRGILRFRRGAFEVAREANVPVLPVVLVGTGEFMAPGQWALGRFRIDVEVLAPRCVDGDPVEFRRRLREELISARARIVATRADARRPSAGRALRA